MITLPNGKVVRNLPEQVAKNLEDIVYLAETYKNLDEQVATWPSYKESWDQFEEDYANWTATLQGYLDDISDAALSAIANGTVSGNFNVSGNFTANSIIENMAGYAFATESPSNWTFEYVYASAVKNGNKVTLVLCMNLTKAAGASNFPAVGTFTIPTAVYNKLYPTRIGDYSWLDVRVLNVFSTENNSVAMPIRMSKGTTGKVGIQINATNLVEGTSYYARYEVTFLLSDSLLP